MTSANWTPERIDQLRELCAEGLSFAAVGEALGISKNAAIGKALRIGINKTAAPHPARRRPRQQRSLSRRGLALKEIRWGKTATGASVALLDLREHHCRWPVSSEGVTTLFCGAPKIDGAPYCPAHCALAYSNSRLQAITNA